MTDHTAPDDDHGEAAADPTPARDDGRAAEWRAPEQSVPATGGVPAGGQPSADGQQPPAYGQQPAAYGQQPAYAQQPPYGQPLAYGQQPPPYAGYPAGPPAPPQTLSIISMIAGIVGVVASLFYGFGLLPGIAAVVLGFLGRTREPEAKGFRLTGLITGFVAIGMALLWIIGIIVFVVIFASHTQDFSSYDG